MSKRTALAALACIVAGAAPALATEPAAGAPHSPYPSGPHGSVYHEFIGVTAISPTDALAVGVAGDPPRTHARYFDGTRWRVTRTGEVPLSDLESVVAISPTDAWAVGGCASTGHAQAYHWDGSAWTPFPTPAPKPNTSDTLESIDAAGPNDVWAVGYNLQGLGSARYSPYTAIIEHWNGRRWSRVQYAVAPPAHRGLSLDGITVVNRHNAWAVGSADYGSLVEHWDGRHWTQLPGPQHWLDRMGSSAISAVTAHDIWAVGGDAAHFRYMHTRAAHYNGHKWKLVPIPNGRFNTYLLGVDARASNDVWAVGSTDNAQQYSLHKTFIEHWDGAGWSIVPSPSPGVMANELFSVSADSATDAWAVGYSAPNYDHNDDHALIEHWDGHHWRVWHLHHTGALHS